VAASLAYEARNSKEWTDIKDVLKTLQDEAVSIRIGIGGRGLFNGSTMAPTGVPFVEYGGLTRHYTDYDPRCQDALASTHARRNGATVLDGKPLADLFPPCYPQYMADQLRISSVEHRGRLHPMKHVPNYLKRLITQTGCGYFANSSHNKKQHNVRLKTVQISDSDTTRVFIPTKDIQPFEEIVSPM
jgi:hypothetical protein